MLVELARREREAGIFPEKDVDVYMKAIAVEGQEHSLVTDYIMKVPNGLYSTVAVTVRFPACVGHRSSHIRITLLKTASSPFIVVKLYLGVGGVRAAGGE
jgi:hypothetical protein